jgi:hypothetical protein
MGRYRITWRKRNVSTLRTLTLTPALLTLLVGASLASPLHAAAEGPGVTPAPHAATLAAGHEKDGADEDADADKDADADEDTDEDEDTDDKDGSRTDTHGSAPGGGTAAPAPVRGLVAPISLTRNPPGEVAGVTVVAPEAGAALPLTPAVALTAGGIVLLVGGRRRRRTGRTPRP